MNDPARLQNDEWYEFAARAQAGRARSASPACRATADVSVECLDLAVDKKLVDVVLVAFNFGQDPAFYERFTGSFDFVGEPTGAAARAREGARRGHRRRSR